MNDALIEQIMGLVEEAIKVEPAVQTELQNIFAKPSPTAQDWLDAKTAILSKRFRDLVPDTQLPDA